VLDANQIGFIQLIQPFCRQTNPIISVSVAAGFNMLNFSRFENVWRLREKLIASATSGP
jgi:hypothetical protein